MRAPRFGLRTRVTVAVIVVTTAATAIMAYASHQLQRNEALGRFAASADAVFERDFDRIAPAVGQPDGGSLDLVSKLMAQQPADWAVVSMKADGSLGTVRSATNPRQPWPTELVITADSDRLTMLAGYRTELFRPERGPRMTSVVYTTVPSTGHPVFVLTAGFATPGYYLAEAYDVGSLSDDLSVMRWKLVYIAVAVALLGLFAALVAARRIQRPLLRVATAAEQLGAGVLDVRVPVNGRDEVADLAKSFNAMAQHLGESIEELRAKDLQQQRFVADVAHDLRTPLASMVAAVDNLDNATSATRTRATEILGAQARRLARLVEDLLEIAKFDAGKAELRTETVDLRALVEDAAEVSDIDDLAIECAGDITVVADPRRIHTIVCNLLTNAARHGSTPISVSLRVDETDVVVQVRDAGPGVPDELLPILFDRFVRGDRARQATDGSGLGLAIAQENTAVHGGTLTVRNDDGAVFTLTLPRHGQGSLNGDSPADSTARQVSSRGA